MRAPVVAVALLTLLPGCLEDSPFPSRGDRALPDPVACNEIARRAPSGNAPAHAAFGGDPQALAARLAAALGDPLDPARPAPEPIAGEPDRVWATREGWVELFLGEDARVTLLRYWGHRHWTPLDGSQAREDYRRVLTRMGVDPSLLDALDVRAGSEMGEARLDGTAHQTFEGEHVGFPWLPGSASNEPRVDFWVQSTTDERGNRSQFSLGRLLDLANATATLPEEAARATALGAVRCRLADEGRLDALEDSLAIGVPPDGYYVANDSLAHPVVVSYDSGCHASRMVVVLVDAVTGAVVDPGREGAACVE